ncbi:type VI secretion system lipoprotein TssJ [Thaumasiovibrio sp. DFM-14]|uniref:type VI secretion system lipoprotein TssJ n=1 Tax=Thaumasiovibrio sp. DFM-14 TaxID=3384792 RepID=UPI0039A04C96
MRKILLISATLFALNGCAIWGQFKDTVGLIPATAEVEINISTADILNLRPDGSSSPVILRVYELSSPILFRSLGFFSLFENDRAALGDEYIRRYEFQLEPEEQLRQKLILDESTRAVGFAVAFRNVNSAVWRVSHDIDARTSYYLDVTLEDNILDVKNTVGVEQIYF